MISLAKVFRDLDEAQAVVLHQALAQWADNARNGLDEDDGVEQFLPGGKKGLEVCEAVVELLNAELAKLAEPQEPDPEKIRRALLVMVLDAKHREWMKEHDPKALKQAEESLANDLDFTTAIEFGSVR